MDDDELYLAGMQEWLELAGYEAIVANMATVASHNPDVILLDVMFPGDAFAGLDLARTMHGSPGLSQVPILMLTGLNKTLGLKLSAYDIDDSWLPVTDFLEKPIDFGKLAGKVTSMLQAAGAQPSRAS